MKRTWSFFSGFFLLIYVQLVKGEDEEGQHLRCIHEQNPTGKSSAQCSNLLINTLNFEVSPTPLTGQSWLHNAITSEHSGKSRVAFFYEWAVPAPMQSYTVECADGAYYPLKWKLYNNENGDLVDERDMTDVASDPMSCPYASGHFTIQHSYDTHAKEWALVILGSADKEVDELTFQIRFLEDGVVRIKTLEFLPALDPVVTHGEWSSCSKSCGGGIQERRAKCTHVLTGVTRAIGICNAQAYSIAEVEQRGCNLDPCDCVQNAFCMWGGSYCIESSVLYPSQDCLSTVDTSNLSEWRGVVHSGPTGIVDYFGDTVLDSLTYRLLVPKPLPGSYMMTAGDNLDLMPSAWRLYAFDEGNDLTIWSPLPPLKALSHESDPVVLLDTQQDITWSATNQVKYFNVNYAPSTKKYRTYQLEVLKGHNQAWSSATTYPVQFAFAELDLFPQETNFAMYTSPWGPCSRICGGGSQKRTVECRGTNVNDASIFSVFRNDRCPDYWTTDMRTSKGCNTHTCPETGEVSDLVFWQDPYRFDIAHVNITMTALSNVACGLFLEGDGSPTSLAAVEDAMPGMKQRTGDLECNEDDDDRIICTGHIPELRQETLYHARCLVENVGGHHKLSGPETELETQRGPTLTGCFMDHWDDRDLEVEIPGGNYTVGVCSHLCRDYDYFGLQHAGQCFCGNNEERKWPANNNCACSGPYYSNYAQCVWRQVPPLIRSISKNEYATRLDLTANIMASEQKYYEFAGTVDIKCQLEADHPAVNDKRILEAECERHIVPDNSPWYLTHPCLLRADDVQPGIDWTLVCEPKRWDYLARHVRTHTASTFQVGILAPPNCGVYDESSTYCSIDMLSYEYQNVLVQCTALKVAADGVGLSSEGGVTSDTIECEPGQYCTSYIYEMDFDSEYRVSCNLRSGDYATRVGPGTLTASEVRVRTFTKYDSASFVDNPSGTNPNFGGPEAPAITMPPKPPTNKVRVVDATAIGAFVIVSIVLLALGFTCSDQFAGKRGAFTTLKKKSASFLETAAMCVFELLQWYAFVAGALLSDELIGLRQTYFYTPSAKLKNFAHVYILAFTLSAAFFFYTVVRFGMSALFANNVGGRSYWRYHKKGKRSKLSQNNNSNVVGKRRMKRKELDDVAPSSDHDDEIGAGKRNAMNQADQKAENGLSSLFFLPPFSFFSPLTYTSSSDEDNKSKMPENATNKQRLEFEANQERIEQGAGFLWSTYVKKLWFRRFVISFPDLCVLLISLIIFMTLSDELTVSACKISETGCNGEVFALHAVASHFCVLLYTHMGIYFLLPDLVGAGGARAPDPVMAYY